MDYKRWQCMVCGYVYDEEQGDAAHGLEPGTRWADVPTTWFCPDCGASKIDFEMQEV